MMSGPAREEGADGSGQACMQATDIRTQILPIFTEKNNLEQQRSSSLCRQRTNSHTCAKSTTYFALHARGSRSPIIIARYCPGLIAINQGLFTQGLIHYTSGTKGFNTQPH